MTYENALEYIHQIPKFVRPLGNANLEKLLNILGNPHKKLKYIHIAGTNGKGSTAAMLAQILKHSGYRVGLFTSPFIEVFNERIQINNNLISEGYPYDVVNRVLYSIELLDESETLLEKEYIKLKNKEEDKNKIIQKLLAKGFDYSDIKEIINNDIE